MKRIQGSFGSRDPEDDRRKSRESVISNLILFSALVIGIRIAPYILESM